MKITEREHGRITILEFHENLTGGPQSDDLRNRMNQLIAADRKYVVFSFAHIKFIASQGVGMMIGANKLCNEANGRLVACGSNSRLKTLFNLYQVQSIISFYDTEADAIASFGFEEKARGGSS